MRALDNPVRILCFGDSNTWGADPDSAGRHGPQRRWTGVLAARLGPSCVVIEEGLRGRTTRLDDALGPGRNGADFLLPCLLSHQPLDCVIVMLGTNDLKDRFDQSADDVAASIAHLADIIAAVPIEGPSDRKPLVLIVAPPRLGPRGAIFAEAYARADVKSAALAPALAAMAAARGLTFFDAGSVVTISGGDGVHLDSRNHAALGAALAGTVAALLVDAIPHSSLERPCR